MQKDNTQGEIEQYVTRFRNVLRVNAVHAILVVVTKTERKARKEKKMTFLNEYFDDESRRMEENGWIHRDTLPDFGNMLEMFCEIHDVVLGYFDIKNVNDSFNKIKDELEKIPNIQGEFWFDHEERRIEDEGWIHVDDLPDFNYILNLINSIECELYEDDFMDEVEYLFGEIIFELKKLA